MINWTLDIYFTQEHNLTANNHIMFVLSKPVTHEAMEVKKILNAVSAVSQSITFFADAFSYAQY